MLSRGTHKVFFFLIDIEIKKRHSNKNVSKADQLTFTSVKDIGQKFQNKRLR